MLVVTAMYVGFYYADMSNDLSRILDAPASTVFKGDMAMLVFILLTVIIIERYANRSDTKAIENKGLNNAKENENYFSNK